MPLSKEDKRAVIIYLCIFVAFMQAGLYASRRSTSPSSTSRTDSQWTLSPFTQSRAVLDEHPIPQLMAEAEQNFKRLLSRQSTTLKKAVTEYKRRYGRNPPKGFDQWWNFAQKHSVKIVDDYDALFEDLAPFWDMSGEEFRTRVDVAGGLPNINIVQIRNGEPNVVNQRPGFDKDDVSVRAKGFTWMIEKFQHLLPDLDFPVNTMAEGRVLVPWEHQKYPNLTVQYTAETGVQPPSTLYTPDWRGTGDVWEAYRRTCPPAAPARRLFNSLRAPAVNRGLSLLPGSSRPGDQFSFATELHGNYSFCDNPWAHYLHGHFFSDWRTLPVLFPIFSPSKAPGYSDIRVPSHYYYGTSRRYTYGWDEVNLELKTIDHMETPWEQKSDKIFWRGATTGGGSSPPGFAPQYHRQRFVRMASAKTKTKRNVIFADPPSSSTYYSAEVSMEDLNGDVMDVAFVKAVDFYDYPGGYEGYVADHRFDDGVFLGDHWRHKYLVDLDGMSYSGRFLAFLESDSAVIKSSVQKEFYSDWLQPWLHYIPLSNSYQEIYNIHAFFSGATEATLQAANSTTLELPPENRKPTNGDRRLRRIARAGKQWRRTIGRKEDMEAYMYRLCLEYARLWADDREAMSFSL